LSLSIRPLAIEKPRRPPARDIAKLRLSAAESHQLSASLSTPNIREANPQELNADWQDYGEYDNGPRKPK